MSDAQADPERVLTYGGWRVSRPAGLGRFTMGQTLWLFAASAVLVVVEFTKGLAWAAALAVPVACVALAASIRDKHSMSWLDRRRESRMFKRARRRRNNLFRTGVLGVAAGSSGRCELPGVLGRLRISDHTDAWRRPFTLIRHGDGRLTVPMALAPAGESLTDREEIERKVALWGELLKDLANETGIVAASVVVETSPDSGARLRREAGARRSPDAPDVASRIIDDVVARAAGTGVQVRTWVTLTFDPANMSSARVGRERRAVQDIATRLPGLTQNLTESGDGAVHLLERAELIRIVREAFDPESGEVFERAADTGTPVDLDWSEAGPVSAEATWDSYRHDSGLSRVWVVSRPPQGVVQARVLRRVLEVSRDVEIKRVTVLYRPMDPARAPEVVERDVDKADNRRRMATRPTQRMHREVAQAVKTAGEEAGGAAVVDFGIVITATVTGDGAVEQLEAAGAAVGSGAAGSHLLIRTAYGSQDSAFALGLPLGLMPDRQRLSGGGW